MDGEASSEPAVADAVFVRLWVFAEHVTALLPSSGTDLGLQTFVTMSSRWAGAGRL